MNHGNLPSSFASAAAGQNANRDNPRGGRIEGRGSGDWARRDGRVPASTITFRRPSSNSLGQAAQPQMLVDPTPQSPVDAHARGPVAVPPGERYTKEDLLSIYKTSKPVDADPSRLYMYGWNPGAANGAAARSWFRTDNQNTLDANLCWDSSGEIAPIGLQDYSVEEREAFATDINSTVKPPQKDAGHAGAANGRKAHGATGNNNPNPVGLTSPSAARPGARRRETEGANPLAAGLMSPSNPRHRDEPTWFRRGPDPKEAGHEEHDEEGAAATAAPAAPSQPFGRGLGAIIRSNTAGSVGPASAGLPSGASSSIWNQTPTTPSVGASASGNVPALPSTGSFGFFSHQPSAPIGEKRFGAPAPRESRLAHLIPNNGSQNAEKPQESPGLDASRGWPSRGGSGDDAMRWKGRSRTDTDPYGNVGFGGDTSLTGSAALGGLSDSPPQTKIGRVDASGKPSAGDFGMSQLSLGGPQQQQQQHGADDGPLSPSVTNPYLSPHGGRRGTGDDDNGSDRDHGSNFGSARGFGPGGMFDASGGDRSQTSSAGPRGYPGTTVGGGGVSGWPAPSSAGPERSAFGNLGSIFAPMAGDPGSSSMSGAFGPVFGSRPPKMQSIFAGGLGPQDHVLDDGAGIGDLAGGLRQTPNPLGAIGRGTFGLPPRENDSPIRTGGGRFDTFFPPGDAASRPNPIYSPAEAAAMSSGMPTSATQAAAPAPFTGVGATAGPPPYSGGGGGGGGGGSGSGEPQQRQMVMPDRMRWTYLDPQGNVQGPFTGCEMHDWYKALFFTPDLRVKKLEDPDFEPLGVMIRRIGNSREPFLVPQVGVAHGPPTQSGPYSPPSSGIIPPLSGVFPSFGRTLTAEEQNNLERRKQEEQFMLAQQRDYQIRHQSVNKLQQQQQHMGPAPMLQHHSSAHSLHSQPSFGNMASMAMSPVGPMPGGMPGGFGVGPVGMGHPLAGMPPNAAGLEQAELPHGGGGGGDDEAKWRGEEPHMGPTPAHPGEAASLRAQLPRTDDLTPDEEGFHDRLIEFEQLRIMRDAEQAAVAAAEAAAEQAAVDAAVTAAVEAEGAAAAAAVESAAPNSEETDEDREPATQNESHAPPAVHAVPEPVLTMAQQVQRAHMASTPDIGIPMPFPPAADAPHQSADHSRQQSRSPDSGPASVSAAAAAPPPMAPWAKDPATESQKGPSLKEIQEAEARKAAKAEEIAAAQRKRQAQQEQEMLAQREREKTTSAQAQALPTTSTWGSGSPVPTAMAMHTTTTPATVAAAAWAKPTGTPASVGGPTTAPSVKKTLADIQREEEQRKQKAKETAHQAGAPSPAVKSYANLASKVGPATPLHQHATLAAVAAAAAHSSSQQPGAPSMAAAAGGGGWSTVGANGKVKMPPTGPAASRSVSAAGGARPPTAGAGAVKQGKPAAVAAPSAGASDWSAFDEAQEDFKKSVAAQLRKGITESMDIDTLVETLYTFPLDATLIADVIYMHSKVMDGRHFAEEFIRGRKLADKGIFEKPSGGDDEGSDGWSEVVKRGQQQPQQGGGGGAAASASADAGGGGGVLGAAGFKVVPGRKRGKK